MSIMQMSWVCLYEPWTHIVVVRATANVCMNVRHAHDNYNASTYRCNCDDYIIGTAHSI